MTLLEDRGSTLRYQGTSPSPELFWKQLLFCPNIHGVTTVSLFTWPPISTSVVVQSSQKKKKTEITEFKVLPNLV